MSPRPPFPPPMPKPNKHRLFIGLLLSVVLAGGGVSYLTSGGKSTRKAPPKQDIVIITPLPPPPPPPPKIEPPKQEPPPDDKQEEVVEEEPVDLTPPDAPIEKPSEDIATGIKGDGSGMSGVGASGNGGGGGNRIGGSGGKNPYASYSLSAKSTIESALRSDPVTRKAILNGLKLEFWPDSGGTIIRARVIGSSAGSELDAAVKRVLVGLRTPPAATAAEMPPSVKIRINARKAGV